MWTTNLTSILFWNNIENARVSPWLIPKPTTSVISSALWSLTSQTVTYLNSPTWNINPDHHEALEAAGSQCCYYQPPTSLSTREADKLLWLSHQKRGTNVKSKAFFIFFLQRAIGCPEVCDCPFHTILSQLQEKVFVLLRCLPASCLLGESRIIRTKEGKFKTFCQQLWKKWT